MNTISSLLEWIGNTIGDNPNNLKTTSKTLVGGINGVWEFLYPVGCFMWTTDANYNPQTALGGTWEKLDAGITLVSAGTGYAVSAGTHKDGGEATHLLTAAESGQRALTITGGNHEHTIKRNETAGNGSSKWSPTNDGNNTVMSTTGGGAHTHYVGAANASSAHNNMPPYKNAYCWHRTA